MGGGDKVTRSIRLTAWDRLKNSVSLRIQITTVELNVLVHLNYTCGFSNNRRVVSILHKKYLLSVIHFHTKKLTLTRIHFHTKIVRQSETADLDCCYALLVLLLLPCTAESHPVYNYKIWSSIYTNAVKHATSLLN